jgi:hypothetical protein
MKHKTSVKIDMKIADILTQADAPACCSLMHVRLECCFTWCVLGHTCSILVCRRRHLTETKTNEGEIKERGFEVVEVEFHIFICLLSACVQLQVQLSVLKEEKRQMLLQLRLEEAERNKRNVCNDSLADDISGKMK